ncbi:3-oxoacyl-[acyl-carrier-protein] synthase III C-terminal domain-containing protein [Streptomyces sp. NPDC048717]|uniref:3-oxoacyl-ACP synthase III family protein n=1 Tax=unclassified Streptomyces TaxID=2593676 RepID=UPI00342DAB85
MAAIVDFEVCLPSGRVTTRHMAEASGLPEEEIRTITVCDSFPVLGDGEAEWELALNSARTLLKRHPVPLSSIRTVIYAGTGVWDVPFGSPSARVAHELGIERAHCFELGNHCNAVTVAIQLAADLVAGTPGEYALVLLGDRVSTMIDYTDGSAKELFNNGDAGAALLLAHSGGIAEVLGSRNRTDPSWATQYTGSYEGDRIVVRRESERDGLAEAYAENFVGLTNELLESIGAKVEDVSYLLVTHGARPIHENLLKELGLAESRSVLNYDRLGHMGGADTLIAMRDLMAGDRLRPGDLVLHATSAIGFTWGVLAMKYLG